MPRWFTRLILLVGGSVGENNHHLNQHDKEYGRIKYEDDAIAYMSVSTEDLSKRLSISYTTFREYTSEFPLLSELLETMDSVSISYHDQAIHPDETCTHATVARLVAILTARLVSPIIHYEDSDVRREHRLLRYKWIIYNLRIILFEYHVALDSILDKLVLKFPRHELYKTKNMYQFLSSMKVDKVRKRWLKRIRAFAKHKDGMLYRTFRFYVGLIHYIIEQTKDYYIMWNYLYETSSNVNNIIHHIEHVTIFQTGDLGQISLAMKHPLHMIWLGCLVRECEYIETDEIIDCSICKDEVETSWTIKLTCNHKFHEDCLMPWINLGIHPISYDGPTCPLCRKFVATPSVHPLYIRLIE